MSTNTYVKYAHPTEQTGSKREDARGIIDKLVSEIKLCVSLRDGSKIDSRRKIEKWREEVY